MAIIKLITILLVFLIISSCKKQDINQEILSYPKETISYYSEIGFRYKKTIRWEKDINISVQGKYSKKDVAELDTIIKELRTLIHPLEISKVEENGNLIINFPNSIRGNYHGLTHFNIIPFTGLINSIKIDISPYSQHPTRYSTLRHEFMHALGFSHPMNKGENSCLSIRHWTIDELTNDNYLVRFSDLDKTMIKIHYSKLVPTGFGQKKFEEYLINSEY